MAHFAGPTTGPGTGQARDSVTSLRTTVENLAIALSDVRESETLRGWILAITDVVRAGLSLPEI